MVYSIDYATVIDVVKEEVSKEASMAVNADGASLYDKLKITSRDEEKMKRLALGALVFIKEQCERFISRATIGENPISLNFTLNASTRRTSGRESSIQDLLQNICANTIIRKYFLSKNETDLSAKYEAIAAEDLSTLKRILYTKTPPSYSC